MDKTEKEKETIRLMIQLYCKKKHKHKHELCEECNELYEYATLRINKCPFKETKTFCSSCKVHCYSPEKRQKVRDVMRFSGPRMLFYRPNLAISHVYDTMKNKRSKK